MHDAIDIVRAVEARAAARLPARAGYARDVLAGRQHWSGSDLRGAARRWGARYATQRAKARAAWLAEGGAIIRVAHGLHVSAVHVDDTGNGYSRYATHTGYVTVAPGAVIVGQ